MAKVLLVEDDNNLREIYEARLQAEGYDTSTASDGEQALVIAKDFRPDLVISDVMMPKISGFEMLDILRNTDGLKDVRVIMLTALGQAEDKARADQLGADKYLVKSQVTLEDIVKTAHQLLDDSSDPAPVIPSAVTETPQAVAVPAPISPEPAVEPTTPIAAPIVPEAIAETVPQPVTAPEPMAAPIPEPIVTPAPVPTAPVPAPAQTTFTPTAVEIPEAASSADELRAMQAQIDSFVAQPAVNPPVVDLATAPPVVQDVPVVISAPAAPSIVTEPVAPVVPATAPPAPAPAVMPTSPIMPVQPVSDTTAHDDQVMADAINSLASAVDAQRPSDVTAVEVAPPTTPAAAPIAPLTAPAAPAASDDGSAVGHKRVIQPLNDPAQAKPDINALLAAEEAAASQPVLVAAAPAPEAPVAAPDPALQLSPELQAAVTEADTPTMPAAAPPIVTEPATPAVPAVAPPAPAPPAPAPVAAPQPVASPVVVTEPPIDPNRPNPNDIAL